MISYGSLFTLALIHSFGLDKKIENIVSNVTVLFIWLEMSLTDEAKKVAVPSNGKYIHSLILCLVIFYHVVRFFVNKS